MIDAGGFSIAFDPIIALGEERVFAFEALTRTRVRGLCIAELFDRASENGSGAELNLIGIRNALNAAYQLPADALLFINADPIVLGNAELPSLLCESARRAAFPPARVVLEITERSAFDDVTATAFVLDDLRACGVRFALDDFGSAHSHLAHMDVIRPSFLKIGHGFGTAFEQSSTQTRIVRHIAALARDFDCHTILEGIESPATARAARDLGIEYAQGFHYSMKSSAAA